MSVIISNKEKFEELKKKFKAGGLDNIHVVADFDSTLTKASVNGIKRPSVISVLRDEGYISEDYSEKAKGRWNVLNELSSRGSCELFRGPCFAEREQRNSCVLSLRQEQFSGREKKK